MQIKAIRQGLRVLEVPVSYRRRVGKSKISGTLLGTILAGSKILRTIARHGWSIDPDSKTPLTAPGFDKDQERIKVEAGEVICP